MSAVVSGTLCRVRNKAGREDERSAASPARVFPPSRHRRIRRTRENELRFGSNLNGFFHLESNLMAIFHLSSFQMQPPTIIINTVIIVVITTLIPAHAC